MQDERKELRAVHRSSFTRKRNYCKERIWPDRLFSSSGLCQANILQLGTKRVSIRRYVPLQAIRRSRAFCGAVAG